VNLENVAKQAKESSRKLAIVDAESKNNALRRMADLLEKKTSSILDENKKDLLKRPNLILL